MRLHRHHRESDVAGVALVDVGEQFVERLRARAAGIAVLEEQHRACG